MCRSPLDRIEDGSQLRPSWRIERVDVRDSSEEMGPKVGVPLAILSLGPLFSAVVQDGL